MLSLVRAYVHIDQSVRVVYAYVLGVSDYIYLKTAVFPVICYYDAYSC